MFGVSDWIYRLLSLSLPWIYRLLSLRQVPTPLDGSIPRVVLLLFTMRRTSTSVRVCRVTSRTLSLPQGSSALKNGGLIKIPFEVATL